MLSPLPLKARKTSCMMPTSPVAYSPCGADARDLSAPRAFWYNVDNEATQELRDVLGYESPKKMPDTMPDLGCQPSLRLPDWMPAFGTRCLSAASTCATSPAPPSCISAPFSPDLDFAARSDSASTCAMSPAPPSSISPPFSPEFASATWGSTCATTPAPPSSSSPPFSPDLAFAVRSDGSNGLESPAQSQKTQCPPGAIDKSSWLQARKVFVGGIPQTLDQNGLYHMFSKFGKVKKAWLQLFHADRGAGQQSKEKKHRGFGFVIFYETNAIDQLLGADFSRFACFDDLKLEVKRAVGKTPEQQILAERSATPKQSPLLAPKNGTPAGLMAPQIQLSGTPQHQHCGRSNEAEVYHSNILFSSPQSWHSGSPALSQPWLRAPSQAVLVGFQNYVNLPLVPAFPCVNGMMIAASPGQSQVPVDVQPQVVPTTLFGGLVGQTPVNYEALTQALLDALPDVYED